MVNASFLNPVEPVATTYYNAHRRKATICHDVANKMFFFLAMHVFKTAWLENVLFHASCGQHGRGGVDGDITQLRPW